MRTERGRVVARWRNQTRRRPRMNRTRATMARMMKIVYNMPVVYPASLETKHQISHRGQNFRQICARRSSVERTSVSVDVCIFDPRPPWQRECQ